MITLYLMTNMEPSYETSCFNKRDMMEKVMCTYIPTHSYNTTINLHFGKMVMVILRTNADAYEIIWKKYEESAEKYIMNSFIRFTLHHILLGMK
jgi:hypothetical protein